MTTTTTSQPWRGVPASGGILRPVDAAARLGCSVPTLYTLIAKGLVPKPQQILPGCRAVGVPASWIDAIISERFEGADHGR